VIAARNLLERALALATADQHLHAEIGLELAEQLTDAGDLSRTDQLLKLAEQRDGLAARAVLARFKWLILAEPDGATNKIDARLPEIIEQLERASDERALAKAHLVWAERHWLNSRGAPTAEQALLAAEHAERAGDDALRSRARARYASTLWSSEQHASEVRREVEALDAGSTGPYLDHYIGLLRGYLAEWDGHFEEALAWTQRALESSEALGMRERAGAGYRMRARTELLAGDPAAARASLEQSDHILTELGERTLRSTTQAWLAEVNAELGDRDGALAAVELAEELGDDEDFVSFVSTHGVRATLALAEHDLDAAERWARSAIDYANQTNFYELGAGSTLGLSRVLAARGATNEARTEAQAALEIYTRKGDLPRAARARALLDQLDL
jgi:hypothetical protein